MFSEAQLSAARDFLDRARARGLKVVTAESCTGGLIAALLTEIPGSSDVMERGFVTYSNQSKSELLDVPTDLIVSEGAVSKAVAEKMALGALENSRADIAVAVTGIAGPGGGTAAKPVGLVHVAVADAKGVQHREFRFGAIGRSDVRLKTVEAALAMLAGLF